MMMINDNIISIAAARDGFHLRSSKRIIHFRIRTYSETAPRNAGMNVLSSLNKIHPSSTSIARKKNCRTLFGLKYSIPISLLQVKQKGNAKKKSPV